MAGPDTPILDSIVALTENIARITFEDIPLKSVELAKMDILDTLGVSIAATSTSPLCRKVVELVQEAGGVPESTVIGFGVKIPSFMAAFANAALAHSLNYDDLNDSLGIHVGCSIFPAALAAAERAGKVNGREFITAHTLAMDMQCRMARALVTGEKPRDWTLHGWLLPQIFGYFGATAAAGRLLGLNSEQLTSAFGLAYSQTAGNMQPLTGIGADKGVYPAYPAKAGVLSALMALKGISGPKDVLDGRAGLYDVYFHGEYDPILLTADLGKSFEGVGFHAFPCCGSSHPYIETTLRIIEEHQVDPREVESVMLFVGSRSQLLCEPLNIRRNPRVMTEAQFSLPFIVATTMAKGKPIIAHFTNEGIKDPDILSLSNRVGFQPDSRYDTDPLGRPARVEIRMKDSRILGSEQKGPRYGDIRRPISKADLVYKFRDCANYSARSFTADSIEEIIRTVDNLECLDDVGRLARLVS